MEKEQIKKRFKEETRNHTMKIMKGDGIYRHLVFSNGRSNIMRFELITFPGYLCYVGDMGSFTFSRIEDMFEFFRGDGISPGYWSEKLQATDKRGGDEEYSVKEFNEQIMESVKSWEFDSEEEEAEVMEHLEDDVLNQETEQDAYIAASSFESHYGHEFQDFWEYNLREYTYRYIWCLYAIVWGISVYDNKKLNEPF